ncbi:CRE-COM-1 protein [Caenorhabditis remanei]|uniref:CRE-COM-1 protein n=1 Tax=Caenorhabditis remanei TaxID=31234 RepID=E3LYF3_CAERE|nr:CRE-COM-1 protein [Caenorhabditis remanei]
MSGYYRNSSNSNYPRVDTSFDPFSSPQYSGYTNYQNVQQSVDVFAETQKRRSSGEVFLLNLNVFPIRKNLIQTNGISRAIRNALDPEYQCMQSSMDIFNPSTSFDYNDDASILAAVSSAHSSQEMELELPSTSIQKTKKNEKSKAKANFAPIFNTASKKDYDDQTLQEDFLSPDKIRDYYNKTGKQRPKQVRMDDFLFKARRVDKGAREFGLHTTQEPKRGSKKKRDSIEQLEVDKSVFERVKLKKKEEVIKKNKSEVEQLDFSLAFGTPSPARNKSKNLKLTKFFEKNETQKNVSNSTYFQSPKCSITVNDPSMYTSETVLEDTIYSTPNKTVLSETISLFTPSPQRTSQRNGKKPNMVQRSILECVKPNPIKRKDPEYDTLHKDRQPLVQAKRQKCLNNNKKPEFDYSSSPITLNDDEEDINVRRKSPERPTLREEEAQRKKFRRNVSEREQIMRELVDQRFKQERENGGLQTRRAELKDGEVIRNKEMRKNLMHGAACKCCRGYYDGLNMEEQEKKDYINKISRHRYVHQPLPDTPERYWDLTLGQRDEDGREPLMTQERNWEEAAKKNALKSENQNGIHNWN